MLPPGEGCKPFSVEFPPLSGGDLTQCGHAADPPGQPVPRPTPMSPFIAEVVPSDAHTQLVTPGTLTRLEL